MMSYFSGSAITALVALALACGSAVATAQDPFANQAVAEDVVWSTVLSAIAGEEHPLVVVADSAFLLVPDSLDQQFMQERLTDLREATLHSFMRVNAVPRALPEFEALGIAVEHAGTADLAAFHSAGDPNEYWRRFYARYPDSPGLVRLSRVGFDESGQQALIFAYHGCGGRCGTGKYVLLSRSSGEWHVIGEQGVFVH